MVLGAYVMMTSTMTDRVLERTVCTMGKYGVGYGDIRLGYGD